MNNKIPHIRNRKCAHARKNARARNKTKAHTRDSKEQCAARLRKTNKSAMRGQKYRGKKFGLNRYFFRTLKKSCKKRLNIH